MASNCNIPTLIFSIPLPIKLPGLPSFSFLFSLAFSLPACPLD